MIPAWGRALVQTDIAVELPAGCYGRVAPRSGLALKFGIDLGGGVVDPDYRGSIGIITFNLSNDEFRGTSLTFRFSFPLKSQSPHP